MKSDVALVVIDMQNDFCLPTSPLFVADAPSVTTNVAAVTKAFRVAGSPVVMVLRQHRAQGVDVDHTRSDLFERYPFLVTSPGADLVEGLSIAPSDVVVFKRRWSAFFATDLDLVLRRMQVGTVVVAGVQTPNCIRAPVNAATSLDYQCVVLSDATASASEAIQAANLRDMAVMGVEIMSTDAVIAWFVL